MAIGRGLPKIRKKGKNAAPKTCIDCAEKTTCKKLCSDMSRAIQDKNGFFEVCRRDYTIFANTTGKETSLSNLARRWRDADNYYALDKVELRTDALERSESVIFFEHFFNRAPLHEIADRLDLPAKSVSTIFLNACDRIDRLAKLMDKRHSATKFLDGNGAKGSRFTDDEKLFLLSYVFGFSAKEAGEVLGLNRSESILRERTRRLEMKYRAAFDSVQAAA